MSDECVVVTSDLGVQYAMVPVVVSRSTEIPPTAKLVFLALASYADGRTGECCPSQARIGQDAGVTRETAARWISWLVEHGWIIRISGGIDKQGRRRANRYSLRPAWERERARLAAESGAAEEAAAAVTPGSHGADHVTPGSHGDHVTPASHGGPDHVIPGSHIHVTPASHEQTSRTNQEKENSFSSGPAAQTNHRDPMAREIAQEGDLAEVMDDLLGQFADHLERMEFTVAAGRVRRAANRQGPVAARAELRRLLTIDGKSPETVRRAIAWLGRPGSESEFWATNVQSVAALRKQFERMEGSARRARAAATKGTRWTAGMSNNDRLRALAAQHRQQEAA